MPERPPGCPGQSSHGRIGGETLRSETAARIRPLRHLPGIVGRPRDLERVASVLASPRDLDNRPILPYIARPAFVVGGEDDRVIPEAIQREMASLLPVDRSGGRLFAYSDFGHENDQGDPEYEREVGAFVSSPGW